MALQLKAMRGRRIAMVWVLQGEASNYLRWSKVRAQPDKIRAALVSREAVAVKVK